MADVQNVTTLGIGSAPGSIHFFLLLGLDINPIAAGVIGHSVASDAPYFHASASDTERQKAVASDDHG